MKTVVAKQDRQEDDYLTDRVQEKINAYSQRGDRNKVGYWVLASTAAVGSALVPAFINIQDIPDQVPTVLSLIVAISLALEGIFRPRELWRNYDLIAADLRAEEMRYSTKTAPYTADDRFSTLVQRIEDKIAEERAETILTRTTPGREGGQPPDDDR